MANLSDKLERIELAVDRIRTKVELPTQAIEEVATAVEEMGTGTGEQDIYKVGSIEERDTIQAKENDMCVIYGVKEFNYDETQISNILLFPETIVVESPITSNATTYLYYGSTNQERLMFQLSATYYRVRDYKTMQYLAQYTSTDGKTYTKTSGEAQVTYENNLQPYTSFNSSLTPFIFMRGVSFDGMYLYKDNNWVDAPSQLTATSSYVYDNSYYGKDGVGVGTLQESTITDKKEALIKTDLFNSIYNLTIDIPDPNSLYRDYMGKHLPVLSLTDKVTNLKFFCAYCDNLVSVDFTGSDTSNVTDMSFLLDSGALLKKIDVTSFNTQNVTTMESMFRNCPLIETVDVSSFNTSNVTNMGSLFYRCYALKDINLSNFDTTNVTTFSMTFLDCTSLKRLNLSNFVTPNLTSLYSTFSGCTSLEFLDIRNFTFSNVTSYDMAFKNIPANCLIIVKDTTEKNWVKARRSDLSNVKTVAEYGG